MSTQEFTPYQLEEITAGADAGVDVSVYANPQFLAIQMRELRLALQEHLPIQKYATTAYDWFQIAEIRIGLKEQLDVSKYDDPAIPFDVMRQVRLGLESGLDLSAGTHLPSGILKELRLALSDKIDISRYIKKGYNEEQLHEIRLAIADGIDPDPYLSKAFRGASIHEIVRGLEQGLDVSQYADKKMAWQQMREIRLGMESRLDVSVYRKHLYSWQQMREIRLGMEEDLPVAEYSSLMYTAREMKKRRLALLNRRQHPQEKTEYSDFTIFVEEDAMLVNVFVSEKGIKLSQDDLRNALKERGIVVGIDDEAIARLEQEGAKEHLTPVAHGIAPKKGADGWYEFFFEHDLKKKPKLREDGSVDYRNIKWFSVVKKGDKIAYYHEAEKGEPGYTVTGEPLPGVKGDQLPPLSGRGFVLLPDHKTYIAGLDGKVDWKNEELEVAAVLIVEHITRADADIDFNGSVYVLGSVGDGVCIHATKDLLLNGHAEAAELSAGGDIILREGTNAGGHGHICAGGDVLGTFFENAHVEAGGDIHANYCFNSDLTAQGNVIISGTVGMLAGGTTRAAYRVEAYNIGNDAALATAITVGREQKELASRGMLQDRIASVGRELSLLQQAYEDFGKKYKPEELSGSQMYLKIESAIYTKKLEENELLRQKEQMEQDAAKTKQARVVVQGVIYPGVTVTVNGAGWRARLLRNITVRKADGAAAVYNNL